MYNKFNSIKKKVANFKLKNIRLVNIFKTNYRNSVVYYRRYFKLDKKSNLTCQIK